MFRLSPVEERRVAREIAAQMVSAIEASGARFILVTSPNAGEGKTTLMKFVAPEIKDMEPGRFVFLSTGSLSNASPEDVGEDRIAVVDGPAMLEGDEVLNIPDEWMRSFDGAIIVVVGRKTSRSELSRTVTWLRASGIKPVGVIWNSVVSAEDTQRLQRALALLKRFVPGRRAPAVPAVRSRPVAP